MGALLCRWKHLLLLIFCFLAYLGVAASAFALTSTFSLRRPVQPKRRISCAASLHNALTSEIFLLSFDGTVAKTTEWRISQGIDLALTTWPHLKELDVIAQQEDDGWLRNKMKALSSVLSSRPGASLACDYALLARLLIEEQRLDQGRSNGKRGKYASKFHPQTTNNVDLEEDTSLPNSQGSRPLTVGEISANWNKGGCLAETVLTKYHVNYKNPLPILQENIEHLNQEKDYDTPQLNEAVRETLEDCCGNVFVTIGHESDLDMAKRVLSGLNSHLDIREVSMLDPDKEKATDRAQKLFMTDKEEECTGITLIPIATTHGKTLKSILNQAPCDSTIYVFEASWHALEQAIALFGDNIPRGGSGMAFATIGNNLKLSLNFPSWAHCNSRDTQQNEAMMNPWTNLVSERAFSELLSARIVRS